MSHVRPRDVGTMLGEIARGVARGDGWALEGLFVVLLCSLIAATVVGLALRLI